LAAGDYSGQNERRRNRRIAPKGTVLVRAGTYLLRGRIANLSLGGLSATTVVTAPERLLTSAVEIDLRFDGSDRAWCALGGRLLRSGASSLAAAFDRVPPGFAHTIEEMHDALHGRRRVLSIVLVDAKDNRRAMLADGFRGACCSVIDTATPLEAIVRLGESHFEPDVIAIADSNPATISDELRRFVDREHPHARVLTIGHETVGPDRPMHWLSSADPASDLVTRIRQLLATTR
jgi:hypothetical protein